MTKQNKNKHRLFELRLKIIYTKTTGKKSEMTYCDHVGGFRLKMLFNMPFIKNYFLHEFFWRGVVEIKKKMAYIWNTVRLAIKQTIEATLDLIVKSSVIAFARVLHLTRWNHVVTYLVAVLFVFVFFENAWIFTVLKFKAHYTMTSLRKARTYHLI